MSPKKDDYTLLWLLAVPSQRFHPRDDSWQFDSLRLPSGTLLNYHQPNESCVCLCLCVGVYVGSAGWCSEIVIYGPVPSGFSSTLRPPRPTIQGNRKLKKLAMRDTIAWNSTFTAEVGGKKILNGSVGICSTVWLFCPHKKAVDVPVVWVTKKTMGKFVWNSKYGE